MKPKLILTVMATVICLAIAYSVPSKVFAASEQSKVDYAINLRDCLATGNAFCDKVTLAPQVFSSCCHSFAYGLFPAFDANLDNDFAAEKANGIKSLAAKIDDIMAVKVGVGLVTNTTSAPAMLPLFVQKKMRETGAEFTVRHEIQLTRQPAAKLVLLPCSGASVPLPALEGDPLPLPVIISEDDLYWVGWDGSILEFALNWEAIQAIYDELYSLFMEEDTPCPSFDYGIYDDIEGWMIGFRYSDYYACLEGALPEGRLRTYLGYLKDFVGLLTTVLEPTIEGAVDAGSVEVGDCSDPTITRPATVPEVDAFFGDLVANVVNPVKKVENPCDCMNPDGTYEPKGCTPEPGVKYPMCESNECNEFVYNDTLGACAYLSMDDQVVYCLRPDTTSCLVDSCAWAKDGDPNCTVPPVVINCPENKIVLCFGQTQPQ